MCDQDSTLKRCYRCKIEKPFSDFRKNSAKRDGLTSECRACASDLDRERQKRDPEKLRERSRRHYQNNKADYIARAKEYIAKNPEKTKARKARYAEKNKDYFARKAREYRAADLEKSRAKDRFWRMKYPDRAIANNAVRNARKKRAMPPWVDRKELQAIYEERRRISEQTGVLHHVDHIIPLVNPLVCGLHVPANLRIIPASDNLAKSNKFIPEIPRPCHILPTSLSTTASGSAVATPSRTVGPNRPSSACRCAA